MGRWVLTLTLLLGVMMGASLWWIHAHSDSFRLQALQALITDFQSEKDKLPSLLPADLQIETNASWSLEFKGDELWMTAPALSKKSGEPVATADYDRARAALSSAINTWLAKHPGDATKFPFQLLFKNEPPGTAVPAEPPPGK